MKTIAPLLLLVFSLSAVPAAANSLSVPPLRGYVNDVAGVLTAEQAQTLEGVLGDYQRETQNELVLLIVPSLEGEDLEGYSMQVAEAWKIGQKGKDNGIIILVALAEHKMRIEVGYGLEGTLTDAASSRIIRQVMAPRFRERDYFGGILGGVRAVIAVTRGQVLAEPGASGNLVRDNLFPIALFSFFLSGILGLAHWLISVLVGSAFGFLLPLLFGMNVLQALLGLLIGGIGGLIAPVVLRLLFTNALNPPPSGSWHRRTRGWNDGFRESFPTGGRGLGGGSFGGGGASGQW